MASDDQEEAPKSCSDCGCGCGGAGGGARRSVGGILAAIAALIVLYVVGVAVFGGDRTEPGTQKAEDPAGAPSDPADPADPADPDEGKGTGLSIVRPGAGAKVARVVLDTAGAVELATPFQVTSAEVGNPKITDEVPMLYVGPEKFNDNWRARVDAGDAEAKALAKGHAEADYPGFAKYDFTVAEAGKYNLWVRAFWVDKCGNSVAVSLDGGPPLAITDSNFGRWLWTALSGMNAKLVELDLAAGPHTLTLINREDDCYIDQVLLQRVGGPAPKDGARASE